MLTQVHGKDKIQRDIDLIYESEEEKDGTALLRDNIGDAIEGYAEMEYIEQDGGFVIKIKQKGTKEEVNTDSGHIQLAGFIHALRKAGQ